MWIAITRPVSPSLAQCELTHLAREPIDVPRAAAQHAGYEELPRSLGATVVGVAAAPECPDAVFIEDTAIVLDEVQRIAASDAAQHVAPVETLRLYHQTAHLLGACSDPATKRRPSATVRAIGPAMSASRLNGTTPARLVRPMVDRIPTSA